MSLAQRYGPEVNGLIHVHHLTPLANLGARSIVDPVRAAGTGPLEDARTAEDRHDCATALRTIRPLAARGDAAAQYELGDLYNNGLDVPQVAAEAEKWYRRAAFQGTPMPNNTGSP
jgi:TPR repeat protein